MPGKVGEGNFNHIGFKAAQEKGNIALDQSSYFTDIKNITIDHKSTDQAK